MAPHYDPIGDAFERFKSARDNFDLVLLTCLISGAGGFLEIISDGAEIAQ